MNDIAWQLGPVRRAEARHERALLPGRVDPPPHEWNPVLPLPEWDPVPPVPRARNQNFIEQGQAAEQARLQREAVRPRFDNQRINEFRLARVRARRRARANEVHNDEAPHEDSEELPAAQTEQPRQPAGLGLEDRFQQLRVNEGLRRAQRLEGPRRRRQGTRRREEEQRLGGNNHNPVHGEDGVEERNGAPINEQELPAAADRPAAPQEVARNQIRVLDPTERECRHEGWLKLEGAGLNCDECHQTMSDFVLECARCGAHRCRKCKRRVARGLF